eukprot:Stramenopile-MAST_4_protein_4287
MKLKVAGVVSALCILLVVFSVTFLETAKANTLLSQNSFLRKRAVPKSVDESTLLEKDEGDGSGSMGEDEENDAQIAQDVVAKGSSDPAKEDDGEDDDGEDEEEEENDEQIAALLEEKNSLSPLLRAPRRQELPHKDCVEISGLKVVGAQSDTYFGSKVVELKDVSVYQIKEGLMQLYQLLPLLTTLVARKDGGHLKKCIPSIKKHLVNALLPSCNSECSKERYCGHTCAAFHKECIHGDLQKLIPHALKGGTLRQMVASMAGGESSALLKVLDAALASLLVCDTTTTDTACSSDTSNRCTPPTPVPTTTPVPTPVPTPDPTPDLGKCQVVKGFKSLGATSDQYYGSSQVSGGVSVEEIRAGL